MGSSASIMSKEISANSHIGRRVVAVLAIAITLDTLSQLLWKLAATRLPSSASPAALIHAIANDPLPLLVIGVFLLQLVNWLLVLERVDLSYAQPLTALSYVSVCLLSAWFFGERLDAHKVLGVLLVLAGVVLVSASPMRREKP
ncbi:MAG: EamA family transporter [Pseudomonadota bacterium]|nr:EamA family transporter [Pseudomonadota bacterium]